MKAPVTPSGCGACAVYGASMPSRKVPGYTLQIPQKTETVSVTLAGLLLDCRRTHGAPRSRHFVGRVKVLGNGTNGAVTADSSLQLDGGASPQRRRRHICDSSLRAMCHLLSLALFNPPAFGSSIECSKAMQMLFSVAIVLIRCRGLSVLQDLGTQP
jgi:hypothetical protein